MSNAPLVNVEVIPTNQIPEEDFDYNLITSHEDREWAESAAGFITFGLGQAVVKVLEAGNLLAEAKRRLPHGQYLPWVQQACGLKPQHASKLIKAAEWANVAHAQLLESVTDASTLFILSADTTTEEVREWFMQRCAAGDPPSRREVQERKRSASQPRAPQPAETLALNLLRKGDLDRIREALALADRAQMVTAQQVMAEQRLRELGKARYIAGLEADFHRMKDGSWVRLPHANPVAAAAQFRVPPTSFPIVEATCQRQEVEGHPTATAPSSELMSMERAAAILGIAKHSLTQSLTPGAAAKRDGPFARNGYLVTREGRGMVRLTFEPARQP